MDERTSDFIRTMQIDSFQKLRLLLFLQRHPEMKGTSQEFARELYLGDITLLETIITELYRVGLVDRIENGCKLPNQPEIRTNLQFLAQAFEDPMARQKLLDQVRSGHHML
jgi:hypothetical protein